MKTNILSSVIKGAIFGAITGVIGILLLAGVVKIFSLSQIGIKTANQFVKTISIFLGCITCLKNDKGLIKGLVVGMVFCVLIHLIFAILGSWVGIKSFFFDLIFCVIVGIISGIISVNIRQNYDI